MLLEPHKREQTLLNNDVNISENFEDFLNVVNVLRPAIAAPKLNRLGQQW